MKSFDTAHFRFLNFTDMDADMSSRIRMCRNLPEVRKWMVNPEEIPAESHNAFVASLAGRTDTAYFCVLDHEGNLLGSINIHDDGPATVERGLYLHPDYFGKRLSRPIVTEFYNFLAQSAGITTVTTRVMKTNDSSNALERSLGAKIVSTDDTFNYYRLSIAPIPETSNR